MNIHISLLITICLTSSLFTMELSKKVMSTNSKNGKIPHVQKRMIYKFIKQTSEDTEICMCLGKKSNDCNLFSKEFAVRAFAWRNSYVKQIQRHLNNKSLSITQGTWPIPEGSELEHSIKYNTLDICPKFEQCQQNLDHAEARLRTDRNTLALIAIAEKKRIDTVLVPFEEAQKQLQKTSLDHNNNKI